MLGRVGLYLVIGLLGAIGPRNAQAASPPAGVSDDFYFTSLTEFSQNEYHNLLPPDYLMSIGMGFYKPMLQSGHEYSLGLTGEFKFGQSLILEEVNAISIPLYLTAKYGAGNQEHSHRNLGFGTGIGMEYYRNFPHETGVQEEVLRPTVFVETSLVLLDRIFYLRYSYLFTSPFMTKRNFQVGFLIPV